MGLSVDLDCLFMGEYLSDNLNADYPHRLVAMALSDKLARRLNCPQRLRDGRVLVDGRRECCLYEIVGGHCTCPHALTKAARVKSLPSTIDRQPTASITA